MMAGGIASLFYLVGTVYLYRIAGTLSLDGMIESGCLRGVSRRPKAGFFAVFLLSVRSCS